MSQHLARTPDDVDIIIDAILKQDLPYSVTIGPEKIRSTAQNSRYWVTLTNALNDIRIVIERLVNETGHTYFEMQSFIAGQLDPEQVAVLYAVTPEAAHEVIKKINGVPTSTRLGTKKFQEFEEIMEVTITDVAAEVNRVAGEFEI